MNRRPCWPSAAPGLRSAPSRNEPKTLPTPMAAMPTPIAARPAPITLADARSMIVFPSWYSLDLVEIDGVVQIKRRQKREHIGLDGGNEQLQRRHADDHQQRQHADQRTERRMRVDALDDEAGKHVEQDMPRGHRHEQSQAKAERAHEEADELDRRHDDQ